MRMLDVVVVVEGKERFRVRCANQQQHHPQQVENYHGSAGIAQDSTESDMVEAWTRKSRV